MRGPRQTPLLLVCGVVAVTSSVSGCTAEDEPIDETKPDAKVVAPDTGPVKMACPKRPKCKEKYCDQVMIPAGEFMMGETGPPNAKTHFKSADGRPVHKVALDAFCIDKYEVTLERYENCVDAKICDPKGLKWRETGAPYETTVNHYPKTCRPRSKCEHYAVNGKSYYQAHKYCTWIGGRLCSEAEWERAANGPGPQRRKHPWGNEPVSKDRVNIPSVGSGFVDPVYSHPKGMSVEKIFNLAGNVYEWTRDANTPYKAGAGGKAVKNPGSTPKSASDKVIGRGSCFFTEPTDTVTQRSIFPMNFDWG